MSMVTMYDVGILVQGQNQSAAEFATQLTKAINDNIRTLYETENIVSLSVSVCKISYTSDPTGRQTCNVLFSYLVK